MRGKHYKYFPPIRPHLREPLCQISPLPHVQLLSRPMKQPDSWPVRAPIGERVYYFSANRNCARERFSRILPHGKNNPHSHYNFPSGYKPAIASYSQVLVHSNLCALLLYILLLLLLLILFNPLLSFSRVFYFPVVSVSGTRMAYIQRDRRGGIAASMRKRLREMGTER